MIIPIFILTATILILLNLTLRRLFDKKTSYKKRELHNENDWLIWSFIFFGFLMFFFTKRIKQYRKDDYLKDRLRTIKSHRLIMTNYQTDEYINLNRYFKLKKLMKKTNILYIQ